MKTNKKNIISMVLIFIVFLCANGFGESQSLKDEVVLYGYNDEIYLTDGLGKAENKILTKIDNKLDLNDRSYSFFFSPSLNKSGSKFICLNDFYLPKENPSSGTKLLFADINSPANGTVLTVISSGSGFVLSPIWSVDETKIFYLINNSLMELNVLNRKNKKLFSFPVKQSSPVGGPGEETYIRLSEDGDNIYALVPYENQIVKIFGFNLKTNELRTLYTGILLDDRGKVNKNEIKTLDRDVIEKLFGGLDLPVLSPQFTSDKQFYYYQISKNGFFAKRWLGIFNVKLKKERDIKVFFRAMYSDG